jgi:hypothetical protein
MTSFTSSLGTCRNDRTGGRAAGAQAAAARATPVALASSLRGSGHSTHEHFVCARCRGT